MLDEGADMPADLARKLPSTTGPRAVRASAIPEATPARVRSGVPELDRLLGGGIVVPSSIVFVGAGGTGKTTRACAVASAVACAKKRDALIVSAEMPEQSIVMAARRAGARLDRLLIFRTDDPAAALAEMDRVKPAVVVWDSIQALERSGSDSATKLLVHAIVSAGERHGAVSILVSQVAKDGSAYGSNAIEHAPDAVIVIEPAKMTVKKNRFGPAPESIALPWTEPAELH
jgi:DNA repair protein RadA/Sms